MEKKVSHGGAAAAAAGILNNRVITYAAITKQVGKNFKIGVSQIVS